MEMQIEVQIMELQCSGMAMNFVFLQVIYNTLTHVMTGWYFISGINNTFDIVVESWYPLKGFWTKKI